MLIALLTLATLGARDPVAEGQEAFEKHDWPRTVEIYGRLSQSRPDQGVNFARLGRGLEETGHPGEALKALEKAEALGFSPLTMQYARALAHEQLGQKDAALALLTPLANQGWFPPPGMASVDAAVTVATDARFHKLAATFAVNRAPCVQPGSFFSQLNFWVGNWDVYDRQGNPVGQSRIEHILGDCVVLENWTGSGDVEGKSFNTWNPARKRWEQSWVDAFAAPIFFSGQLESGVMVYHSDQPAPDGSAYLLRLTFTPLPGPRVRQFSQGSKDGGKSWTTEYDFIYVPKGRPFAAF